MPQIEYDRLRHEGKADCQLLGDLNLAYNIFKTKKFILGRESFTYCGKFDLSEKTLYEFHRKAVEVILKELPFQYIFFLSSFKEDFVVREMRIPKEIVYLIITAPYSTLTLTNRHKFFKAYQLMTVEAAIEFDLLMRCGSS